MKKLYLLFSMFLLVCAVSAQSIDSSMVGYWPFNGSTDDFSPSQRVSRAYGAKLAPDRFGNPSSAYYFDGIDDFIEVRDFGTILPKDTISICMWVKSLASRPQNQLAFETNNSKCGISIDNFNEGRNTAFWDFGWKGEAGNPPGRAIYRPLPYDSEWHHYVFTSNFITGQMKIYRDGVLITSESDAMQMPASTEIKSLMIGSSYKTSFFYGYIDDVRIYNHELSQQEITTIYKSK